MNREITFTMFIVVLIILPIFSAEQSPSFKTYVMRSDTLSDIENDWTIMEGLMGLLLILNSQ
tara:strand:+ start:7140 stop:7325 length:186 start_codon:yes stop_codon:yes gene_type:complete